jgi:hypothetical protein
VYIGYDGLATTNDARLFGLIRATGSDNGLRYNQHAYTTQVFTESGEMLLDYRNGGIPWFSPSGYFLLLDHSAGLEGSSISTPIVLIRIHGITDETTN